MRFSLVFRIMKHFFFLNSIFIVLFSLFHSELAALSIPLTFSISLYIPLCLCYNG